MDSWGELDGWSKIRWGELEMDGWGEVKWGELDGWLRWG